MPGSLFVGYVICAIYVCFEFIACVQAQAISLATPLFVTRGMLAAIVGPAGCMLCAMFPCLAGDSFRCARIGLIIPGIISVMECIFVLTLRFLLRLQDSAGGQDAMRGFISAIGGVPPFTWLEQSTRDDISSRKEHRDPTSSVSKASQGQADHLSKHAESLAHRSFIAVGCLSLHALASCRDSPG